MKSINEHLFLYEGTGNRLVLFDDEKSIYYNYRQKHKTLFRELQKELIAKLIQNDGDSAMILYRRQEHLYFSILERDFSESCLCGNGLGVIAHFLLHTKKHLHSKTPLHIFSSKNKQFFVSPQRKSTFTAQLGKINSDPKKMHGYLATDLSNLPYHKLIDQLNFLLQPTTGKIVAIADIGKEPHLVITVPLGERVSIHNKQLKKLGEFIMLHRQIFPTGININFIQHSYNHTIRIATFERGVNNFTRSCGTGAVCSAFAMLQTNHALTGVHQLKLKSIGGTLIIDKNDKGEYSLTTSVRFIRPL
jgi:diaminopimelate epimerase